MIGRGPDWVDVPIVVATLRCPCWYVDELRRWLLELDEFPIARVVLL